MALQTKSIAATGSKGHHNFTLYITENSTNISGNSSNLSFDFQLSPKVKNWDWLYQNSVPVSYTITINGVNYTGNIMSYDGVSTVSIRSGSLDVAHNADGSKSISYSFSVVSHYDNSVVPGSASASGTMALTTIPRKATITAAPNFNDEENPTITYSNPAGNSATKLEACISLTGAAADIAYREIVDKTGTSYTFNLTEAERKVLRKSITSGTSRTVKFYLRTTIGTNVEHHNVDRTLTLINYDPIVSVDVRDNNPDTVALTGNSERFIKGHSTLAYTITATARKEATISQYLCNGVATNATDAILNVASTYLTFGAKDSRGNTTNVAYSPYLINYVDVSCSQKVKIELTGETTAKITVDIEGNYFNGSFGKQSNELFLVVYYQEAGSSERRSVQITEAHTPTFDGNTFRLTATLPGDFDYSKPYTIETQAFDKLSSASSGEYTARLTPVFDWSDTDFNFNVPISINGQEMKDFIVEQGTSNGWTYKLWNSGLAECWRRLQITTAVSNAWGGLYTSGSLSSTNLTYPFTFTETPTLAVSLMPFGSGGLIMATGNGYGSATQTGPFEIARGTSLASGQFLLAYHSYGRWK